MKIRFLGAVGEVTGSNFLIETKDTKFIVDCGLFQGSDELEEQNEQPFAFTPSEIDFMLLSHAHIDHSGRIPKLVSDGFRGSIYATRPTVDLCSVMLLDSAKIQEGDAEWENKKRLRAGKKPIVPLYTMADAENALKYFVSTNYGVLTPINEYVTVRFRDAGHILGSSIVEMFIKEDGKMTKLVFSGDLGMPNKPIIRDPEMIDEADVLIMESTYGNTVHEDNEDSFQKLTEIIHHVTNRGGSVIIPSFAVGRTQELIYQLNTYFETMSDADFYKRIPIYIDSPMAIDATKVFMKNTAVFDDNAKKRILEGDNVFQFDNLKFVRSVEESKMLNQVRFPRVIISASGMATAGRVRHHLKHHLWDKKSAVVFVGYQAEGTLGRLLKEGVKEVKLLGEEIAVNCEIYSLEGFSGHADEPMLLSWLDSFTKKPKKVFLVHGEERESLPLQEVIEAKYHIEVIRPSMDSEYQIVTEGEIPSSLNDPDKIKEDIQQDLQETLVKLNALERNKRMANMGNLSDEEYQAIKNELLNIKSSLINLNLTFGK